MADETRQAEKPESEPPTEALVPAEEMQRFTQFAIDHLSDAAYWVQSDGRIIYVNAAATKMLGYSQAELLSMRIYDMNPDVPADKWSHIWGLLRQAGQRRFQGRHRAKSGRLIPVEISSSMLVFHGKEYSCAFVRDITDRLQMENRLRQSEKMEAIGQLAGGVAHDFNNQLAGISGYADLLQLEPPDASISAHYVEQIHVGVKRASDLTKQLLAFARRGKHQSEPVDLKSLTEEVAGILERSVNKKVTLIRQLSNEPAIVAGDPTRLQNAVLNLALNARDAMPEGGLLTLATEIVDLNAAQIAQQELRVAPGQYVQLSVTDTGQGMTGEVMARIFEPFFTTKKKGQGTGLGLAAVRDTITTHSGAIQIESEPDKGTVVRLYFPLLDGGVVLPATSMSDIVALPGKLHVLVVDDEAPSRETAILMLESLGCRVKAFEHGAAAMEYYAKFFAEVDLVLLDMSMPIMDGKDTYLAMQAVDPKVRVLLASGYDSAGDVQELLDSGAKDFIQKPFRTALLAEKLRLLSNT